MHSIEKKRYFLILSHKKLKHFNKFADKSFSYIKKGKTIVNVIPNVFALLLVIPLFTGCFIDSRIGDLANTNSLSVSSKPLAAQFGSVDQFVNQSNVNQFLLTGECNKNTSLKLVVDDLEFQALCSNSSWSVSVDLSAIADKLLTINLVNPDNDQILSSLSVEKDTQIAPPTTTNDMNFGSTDSTSEFIWSPVTSDRTGIVDYEVAVGTTPGDTSTLSWISVGTLSKYLISGLTGLMSGTTYYTSVRSRDLAGNISPASLGNGWVAVDKWKAKSPQILGNDDRIHKIIKTADGGAIAVGDIDSLITHYDHGVILSNSGVADPSFARGIGFNDRVYDSGIQSDGKIVAVGWFTEYNGEVAKGIVRINQDGTRDTSFIGGQGTTDAQFEDVAISPDGTILVAGYPTNYNGVATTAYLLKLNSDGSLITSFLPNINNDVYDVQVQSDGKILIGGYFTSVGGTGRAGIARLNSDGTLDTSFNPGAGATGGNPYEIAILATGKYVAVGSFTTYAGASSNRIVRINSDGTRDTTFVVGTGFDSYVNTIFVDGTTYYVGGDFSAYNGSTANTIAKLSDGGAIDTSFAANTGTGGDYPIFAIAKNASGHLIVGGEFELFNGTAQLDIVWLNTNGTIATGYPTGNVFNWLIKTIRVWPDGRAFVGGYFNGMNWKWAYSVLKLDSSFTVDSSFNVPYANGDALSIAETVTGKYLIGGAFTMFGGAANRIVRLNSDGTQDAGFTPGTGFNSTVTAVHAQADDYYVVGGYFTTYQGGSANRIIRLTSTGAVDSGFSFGTGFNNTVSTINQTDDGKIIVGGDFTSYNGTPVGRIVRLNSNGSIDSTFVTGAGFNGRVKSTLIRSNGKMLVVGAFTDYNGTPQNRMVQLNSDGTVDSEFSSPNFDADINSLALQSDGKIVVVGAFTQVNSQSYALIVRLNSQGTIDESFKIGAGGSRDIYYGSPSGQINTVAILNSGEIALGGDDSMFFDTVFAGILYKIGW